MTEDADKLIRKRIEDIVKKRHDQEKAEPGYRGGRKWRQIGEEFCTKILKALEAWQLTSTTLPGIVMREMVGDPDNKSFRATCRKHGIKIKKDNYTNAYNIEKFSVVEEELKKRGQGKNPGM